MPTEAKTRRLIVLGQRKATLTAKLCEVHAEECKLLQELLAEHGPSAGVPGEVSTLAAEPKNK